ncbi:MAG TPA: diguanylate cyclase [Thermodesulfovibrionales bacterium]|nr:diguanylate cyclase [Thermodesulfovibrionales bacterium]
MGIDLIDIGSLSELRDCVTGLTNLDLSVYDENGNILILPTTEDPAALISRDEYQHFVRGCLEKTIHRKRLSLFRGFANQYQCFFPVKAGDRWLVFAGKSFYIREKDRRDFLDSKASLYGREEEMGARTAGIGVRDIRTVSPSYGKAQRIFDLFVANSYQQNLVVRKYRRTRTITDLLLDIDQTTDEGKVFELLADTVIMLFGGDTVSVMKPSGETVKAVLTTGRLKEHVEKIALKTESVFMKAAMKSQKPLLCSETIELLRLGYPDIITSLHVFPLSARGETFGVLALFNSSFTEDELEGITKLCSFMSFIVRNLRSLSEYERCIRDLAALNFSASKLSPALKSKEVLYESIVEISSRLVNVEKASLMLPEKDRQELFIKAVKGINKWLARNIRVRVGEGIAGRVYHEGKPLLVSDIEKNLSTKKRARYRTGSFISIPLKIGDETIGVLNVADKVSGEIFTETDVEFLRYFASYASVVLRGAHYYQVSNHMRTLSITDSLTGLFNRRYFDDRLFEELQRSVRYNTPFSLAILDIDNFKEFNDTEGHVAGDEALKTVANITRESLRSIDILSRFGGEEFSVIMPQTDKDEAFLVAERVRKNVRDLLPASWRRFPYERMTVSIGIATFPDDGKDAKTMVRNADKALYRAKLSGKDCTIEYSHLDTDLRESHSRDSA